MGKRVGGAILGKMHPNHQARLVAVGIFAGGVGGRFLFSLSGKEYGGHES